MHLLLPTLTARYPGSRLLDCPECGGHMVLRKSPKYPQPFYGCLKFPFCSATHGAHPDGSPLGIPADKETKEWRIKAHAALDPLWGRDDTAFDAQQAKHRRKMAYNWLAAQLDIKEVRRDCHIAMFNSAQCQAVIAACENTSWEAIECWYQQHKTVHGHSTKPRRRARPPRYAHY